MNATNPDLNVNKAKSLTSIHVSVPVQIDRGAVLTTRYLTKIFASASVQTYYTVLQDNGSTKTNVSVSVLTPYPNAPSHNTSIAAHVSVNVPISQRVILHTVTIPTPAVVSVLLNLALRLITLIEIHVVATVAISTPVPRAKSSTNRRVSASVPGLKSASHHSTLIQIRVSASALTIITAHPMRFTILVNAGVNAGEILNVVDTTALTREAVIVCATTSVLSLTFWTIKHAIVNVIKFALRDTSSTISVSVSLSHVAMQKQHRSVMLQNVTSTPTSIARKFTIGIIT